MANLINDFLSMPLWLSLPLCVVYLALLAYFVYILWRYRGKNSLLMLIFLFTMMCLRVS